MHEGSNKLNEALRSLENSSPLHKLPIAQNLAKMLGRTKQATETTDSYAEFYTQTIGLHIKQPLLLKGNTLFDSSRTRSTSFLKLCP